MFSFFYAGTLSMAEAGLPEVLALIILSPPKKDKASPLPEKIFLENLKFPRWG